MARDPSSNNNINKTGLTNAGGVAWSSTRLTIKSSTLGPMVAFRLLKDKSDVSDGNDERNLTAFPLIFDADRLVSCDIVQGKTRSCVYLPIYQALL